MYVWKHVKRQNSYFHTHSQLVNYSLVRETPLYKRLFFPPVTDIA